MGRSLSKNKKRKNSKPFDPKREYVNEAVKDYLQRGGKITKIIDESAEYDQFGIIPEGFPAHNGFMTEY